MTVYNSLVFGIGELSRVASYYLPPPPFYVVDKEFMPPAGAEECDFAGIPEFMGKPVIEFDKDKILDYRWKMVRDGGLSVSYLPFPKIFLGGIGYKKMNKVREDKFNRILEWGWSIEEYISPAAIIHKDVILGQGNYIQELVTIQTGCQVGDNNTFWANGVHIGHGSTIGSNNWFASGCVVSGGVKVGNNCFFSVNTSIRDNIEIADETLVGMGAVITKSTEKGDVFLAGVNNKSPKKSWEIDL